MCEGTAPDSGIPPSPKLATSPTAGTIPTNVELYNFVRDQIAHEDGLINHRVTWLLTLQGFLFGAYGFSLSAQAIASSTAAQDILEREKSGKLLPWLQVTTDHIADCLSKGNCIDIFYIIYNARLWIARMGLAASLVLLFGTGAASVSIIKLITYWKKDKNRKKLFPDIAGISIPIFGAYAGLMPIYFIPVATGITWTYLVPGDYVSAIIFKTICYTAFIGILIAVCIQFWTWFRKI